MAVSAQAVNNSQHKPEVQIDRKNRNAGLLPLQS
jgi:hypothetical protein